MRTSYLLSVFHMRLATTLLNLLNVKLINVVDAMTIFRLRTSPVRRIYPGVVL